MDEAELERKEREENLRNGWIRTGESNYTYGYSDERDPHRFLPTRVLRSEEDELEQICGSYRMRVR